MAGPRSAPKRDLQPFDRGERTTDFLLRNADAPAIALAILVTSSVLNGSAESQVRMTAHAADSKVYAYLLIFLTILFTVSGQLLAKSAMLDLGPIPQSLPKVLPFLFRAYTQWKVLACLSAAVLASVCWMGAVSRSDISFAYPFMGLAIVLVLALSPLFFGEKVPFTRWVGLGFVVVGLWISSRS